MKKTGIENLGKLAQAIRAHQQYYKDLHGEVVSETTEVLIGGDILWQNSPGHSAEEKAKFEQEFKVFVDRMRIASQDTHSILKKSVEKSI